MESLLVGAIAVSIAISAPHITSASTPIVDAHNHEGLSAEDGVIDISKLEDLKNRGITVALVAPGMVDTQLLADSGYRGKSLTPEESVAGMASRLGSFHVLGGDHEGQDL